MTGPLELDNAILRNLLTQTTRAYERQMGRWSRMAGTAFLDQFTRDIARYRLNLPTIPFISGSTKVALLAPSTCSATPVTTRTHAVMSIHRRRMTRR